MSYEQIQTLQRTIFNLNQTNKIIKERYVESLNRISTLMLENENVEMISKEKNDTLEKLIDIYRCSVCLERPKNIILQPCFHFCLCSKCLIKLDKCPICRDDIDLYNIIF